MKNLNRSQLIFEAKKNGIKVTSKDSTDGIINKFRTSNLITEYLPTELSIDEQIRDILFKYLSDSKDIDTVLGYGPEDLKRQIYEKFPNINLKLELAHYHKDSILKVDEMKDEIEDILGDEFIEILPDIKYVNITTYGDEISIWIHPKVGKYFYYEIGEENMGVAPLVNKYININKNTGGSNRYIFLNLKYNPIIHHIDEAVSKYKMDSQFFKHVWDSYMQYNPTPLAIEITDAILKMNNVVEIGTEKNELHLYVTDKNVPLLPKGYIHGYKNVVSLFAQTEGDSDKIYGHIKYTNKNYDKNVNEYIYKFKSVQQAKDQMNFIVLYNWNQFPYSNIKIE